MEKNCDKHGKKAYINTPRTFWKWLFWGKNEQMFEQKQIFDRST